MAIATSGPAAAVVAGRLLCDTYLAARDLVHEVDYTLTTLARNLLKQDRSELSPTDIPGARMRRWRGCAMGHAWHEAGIWCCIPGHGGGQ